MNFEPDKVLQHAVNDGLIHGQYGSASVSFNDLNWVLEREREMLITGSPFILPSSCFFQPGLRG